MGKNIQGTGLAIATRFSGSKFADRFGLRKPAERLAYLGTKKGFELVMKQLAKKKKDQPDPQMMLDAPARHTMFDLSLSEEQQMIKDTVRSYAEGVIKDLGHDANEAMGLPETYLQDIMELGLNYFSVPESFGGAATSWSPTTNAIIAEELAWGDFTLAYATLAPVGVANAIVKWGTKAQKDKYLPDYLAETPIKSTIALQEPGALFNPMKKLSTTATKVKNGYRLSGVKTLVPFGGDASLYLVAARFKGKNRLFFVPAETAGISWDDAPAMGLRAAATGTLTMDNILIGANALLGDKDFDYQAFIDLGQLNWCALAVGACQAALDYLIPYVNEREAFGEPISHRQAVAFMIADIGIELEAMRLMVWRAAALAEMGKPFHREAYLAHLLCSEKAMKIGTDAVQLLGGHGFTKEHPAERWYRDLRVLACINSGLHL